MQMAGDATMGPEKIAARMADSLNSSGGIELQYAVVADVDTLELLSERPESGVALIAARVGTTRLIDNQILQFR